MKKAIAIILSLMMIMAVTFPAAAISTVAVKGIKLEKNRVILKAGQTFKLKVAFTPADTTQKSLKYVTANSNVALVDNKGRIIGVGTGSTTITVYAQDDTIFDKFYVTVTKEKVKITMCMNQTGWGGQALDPDLMKEVQNVIEENTGTSLTIIAPPISSYPDKLNVLLSSGQIPDIYHVTKAMDNIQIYTARGYTLPLDDLIKNTPEITSMVDQKFLDYLKVDGKLSALPMYVPQSKVIWLRNDLMTRYGVKLSQTPTTEEFYNEMKKINGKGIVPFCFPKFLDNMPFFFNPHGAYYGIGIKDGKVYDGFNTPEAKNALTYVAKLYKEKIFDQEFLTNENQTMREKLFTGKAASALDYTNRYIYYTVESEKVFKPSDFTPVFELKGPNGIGGNLNEAIQDAVCISSKTKAAESALNIMKFFFFTEEGVKLRVLGVKDKHYTVDDNGIIKALPKATNSGYITNLSAFYLYYPEVTEFGFKWDATSTKYTAKQLEYIEENPKHLGPKYLIPGHKSDLYDKNLPGYKKKIDEISSQIIMGSKTVEKAYADYEAYWKSIKGDEMLAQLNK